MNNHLKLFNLVIISALAMALFVVLNVPVAQAQQQSDCGPGQQLCICYN